MLQRFGFEVQVESLGGPQSLGVGFGELRGLWVWWPRSLVYTGLSWMEKSMETARV